MHPASMSPNTDAAAPSRASRWALAALAVIVVLASAWYGFRQQREGQPPNGERTATATPSASAASGPAVVGDVAGKNEPYEEEIEATRRPTVPAGATQALTWPFWDFKFRQPIPPRDPPLTPPPWRMLGATQSGGVWSVLIVRQGKPNPEFYKVGDSLPGDYRISAITEEDVTLVKDRKAIVLSYIGTR